MEITEQKRSRCYCCLNCIEGKCYWHIKIPSIVQKNEEEEVSNEESSGLEPKPPTPRDMKTRIKEEDICKREIGKLIKSQVGKQSFSCLESGKCQCKCKKFKNKNVKKITKGAAIGGLVVAGAGCIAGAFVVASLTMGAGIITAPPLIFGGLGLMTGAFYEVERSHTRRVRKKALMACYKGKLLDPHDFGIDIDVEGATPLSSILNSEDMSEVNLSTSEARSNSEHPKKYVFTSDQSSPIHVTTPYEFQLPHQYTSNCGDHELKQSPSKHGLVYQGAMSQKSPRMSPSADNEASVPFQINQFSPQQFSPQQFHPQSSPLPYNCNFGQENIYSNNNQNSYPYQWSEQFQLEKPSYTLTVPCYYHPTDDNNMLQTYVNPPYLNHPNV